jgi:AraC-like DNA-binding protein
MDTLNQIQAECRVYSDRSDTHDHPFAQLILPLQGTLNIETLQHQVELSETHLFFLPPQCQHTFYATQHNKFLVLDIPSTLLAQGTTEIPQGGLFTTLDDRWQAVRSLLLAEVSDAATPSDITHLFQYAYHLLLKTCTPRSLHYIHNNYQYPVSLETLAKLEGYNLTYYCEWFKKLTGKTPKTYIQAVRIEHAKQLLAFTNYSILEIAQQVGYDHHSSLTRLFHQLEGVTPLLYRQKIRTLEKESPKIG